MLDHAAPERGFILSYGRIWGDLLGFSAQVYHVSDILSREITVAAEQRVDLRG